MNTWWWVAIGLIAWFGVSLAVGLLLGRFFRYSSQAREAQDAQAGETLAERQEPPQDGPRVALQASKRGRQVPGGALPRGAGVPVGVVPAEARPGSPSWRMNAVTCRISWPILGSGPQAQSGG